MFRVPKFILYLFLGFALYSLYKQYGTQSINSAFLQHSSNLLSEESIKRIIQPSHKAYRITDHLTYLRQGQGPFISCTSHIEATISYKNKLSQEKEIIQLNDPNQPHWVHALLIGQKEGSIIQFTIPKYWLEQNTSGLIQGQAHIHKVTNKTNYQPIDPLHFVTVNEGNRESPPIGCQQLVRLQIESIPIKEKANWSQPHLIETIIGQNGDPLFIEQSLIGMRQGEERYIITQNQISQLADSPLHFKWAVLWPEKKSPETDQQPKLWKIKLSAVLR
jgi:hypothetical protein